MLQAGDSNAFKLIYDRFWNKLLVVAAKRLGSMPEAEEVVQDIFLNLWRKRETFTLKASFENYLAVAVKFEIINRRAKRMRENTLRVELGSLWPPVSDDKASFDLAYLQQQLEQTVNSLPPKCQLVFRLSRDDDYTNKQIAQELGVTEKAVEKHISKALKVLRKRLGNYYTGCTIKFGFAREVGFCG
ncbi:RNA polymerase sigma-70 factor, ECF subfamily [Parapedobacter indicus]|uniref:RNA polymerase sigma-70 factor, ECF subfamily n=1 Tax=Parapedobacter indicus TaxID=1477437 RepID=A0A1I3FFH6_9SPHI|nr:RNA polymerase sigma-70 factor (ECF subfamily) [Parapedobacter indicus]SFI09978.1 RNA polymerase sigma-70 factor, ECF subfamily [Parapedobacter indicus]